MERHVIGLMSVLLLFSISLAVGMYYVGYYKDRPQSISPYSGPKMDISIELRQDISAQNIDKFLKNLTSVPHLAGTEQDFQTADWLRKKLLEFGFDSADLFPYKVLLSFPNMTEPNKVYLLDDSGQIRFKTSGRQTPLYSPEENSTLAVPNFNAYSGTGTVQGGLVYVNYGRKSDFDYLEERGINISGHIVIARYGATFRGNIVKLTEERGGKGVILYSDPQDFARLGRNRTYPDTWWLPGMAVQSGSTNVQIGGDPLTPQYPSIESAYRIPESKANLPKIPVQPVGYDEAEALLRALKEDNEAPADWQGQLDVKYHLGPDFKDPGWTVKMVVHTKNKMVTTYNTIAILHGQEEPDRYVLVGNHHDAWIFGGIDPSSGTAAMLEIARAFGKMKSNHGWRPRRSLIFCFWGAEEYGLVGSYEWVEEHAKVLGLRAVAYLNVDMAVNGNYTLRANAAPLLHNLIIDSSKKIPNPDPTEVAKGRRTVYDTWINNAPDPVHPNRPKLNILGSGSDFASFMHVVGVPSLDIRYTFKEKMGSNPLYHTLYETHHLVAGIIDRGFQYHRAVSQLWAEIALNLTESAILPLDAVRYGIYLEGAFDEIRSRYKDQLEANGATLKYFEEAVNGFKTATENFTSNVIRNLDINNSAAVRRINDKLIQLERQFIDPYGLPGRRDYNHIVFSPSVINKYAGSSFSGLTDLLESLGNRTEAENPKEWAQIKQHLSVIAFIIQAAGKSLSDFL